MKKNIEWVNIYNKDKNPCYMNSFLSSHEVIVGHFRSGRFITKFTVGYQLHDFVTRTAISSFLSRLSSSLSMEITSKARTGGMFGQRNVHLHELAVFPSKYSPVPMKRNNSFGFIAISPQGDFVFMIITRLREAKTNDWRTLLCLGFVLPHCRFN